eukprot:TRINITY_DN1978_c2_g1_i1.p1 TRINITY_DN1978_c2_g1~~TRINITY_DN1978_c2_g1_i1.p1  ORF type:complete len:315 (-),score=61.00 TRINITY_DN1978_c2_g1_i1:63-1007(-)
MRCSNGRLLLGCSLAALLVSCIRLDEDDAEEPPLLIQSANFSSSHSAAAVSVSSAAAKHGSHEVHPAAIASPRQTAAAAATAAAEGVGSSTPGLQANHSVQQARSTSGARHTTVASSYSGAGGAAVETANTSRLHEHRDPSARSVDGHEALAPLVRSGPSQPKHAPALPAIRTAASRVAPAVNRTENWADSQQAADRAEHVEPARRGHGAAPNSSAAPPRRHKGEQRQLDIFDGEKLALDEAAIGSPLAQVGFDDESAAEGALEEPPHVEAKVVILPLLLLVLLLLMLPIMPGEAMFLGENHYMMVESTAGRLR